MKKGLFIFCIAFLPVLDIQAQGLKVAREFGLNMELWTLTGDTKYRSNIEKDVFDGRAIRVADDLMLNLANRTDLPKNTSYAGSTYLNMIEYFLVKDTLDIMFSDYKYVDSNLLHHSNSQINNSSIEYISCQMRIKGGINFETRVLLYIRNGKISKIVSIHNE